MDKVARALKVAVKRHRTHFSYDVTDTGGNVFASGNAPAPNLLESYFLLDDVLVSDEDISKMKDLKVGETMLADAEEL